MMKYLIKLKLKWLAKLYLWRFKPKIIGITGSVGKTSTKDAIYLALRDKLNVRASEKSYNNEIGLPLTIMGYQSPAKKVFLWPLVFIKGLINLFSIKDYPDVLILEMGSDKPGDLEKLVNIAHPNISIITRIAQSHFQAFESMKKLIREKSILVRVLEDKDWAILNSDDKNLEKLGRKLSCRVLFFGLNQESQIYASDIKIDTKGLSFKINYKNQTYPINILGVGEHIIYIILAAFTVGMVLGLKPENLIKALSEFKPLAGRGRILQGKNKILIVDESYNASPSSMKVALKFLRQKKWHGRKIAILGDMKELGSLSKKYHLKLAQWVRFIDLVVLVGEESRSTFNKLIKSGFKTLYYEKVEDLIKDLDKILLPEDLVLVKGSQAIRLEKAVELLLSSIYNPKDVLVRQEKEWK